MRRRRGRGALLAGLGLAGALAAVVGALLLPAGSEAREPERPVATLALILTADAPFDLLPRPRVVPLTITLRNAGPGPAFVNARLLIGAGLGAHEVALTVLGPDAVLRPYASFARPGAVESDDWSVLAAGESVSRTIDLADDFDLDAQGTYAVQATYENREDAPASLGGNGPSWKGRVVSPVLRVRGGRP